MASSAARWSTGLFDFDPVCCIYFVVNTIHFQVPQFGLQSTRGTLASKEVNTLENLIRQSLHFLLLVVGRALLMDVSNTDTSGVVEGLNILFVMDLAPIKVLKVQI